MKYSVAIILLFVSQVYADTPFRNVEPYLSYTHVSNLFRGSLIDNTPTEPHDDFVALGAYYEVGRWVFDVKHGRYKACRQGLCAREQRTAAEIRFRFRGRNRYD